MKPARGLKPWSAPITVSKSQKPTCRSVGPANFSARVSPGKWVFTLPTRCATKNFSRPRARKPFPLPKTRNVKRNSGKLCALCLPHGSVVTTWPELDDKDHLNHAHYRRHISFTPVEAAEEASHPSDQ